MSCPFRHRWPGAPSPHGGEAPAAAETGASEGNSAPPPGASPAPVCPVSGKAASSEAQAARGDGAAQPQAAPPPLPPRAAAPPTPGAGDQQGASPAQCPFLKGVAGVAVSGEAGGTGQTAAEEGNQAQEAAGPAALPAATGGQPAVCPLGFGGGQQPKLGEFHCLICRSLYHDCVRAACGHRYCAGCIRGARDCPICGADLEGLQPDAETQAMVDKYVEAHAGNHTIWELEGTAGQEVEGLAGERSRAAFLLQLGLRAMAAGNTDAARHRFLQCQQELEEQLAAAQQEAGADDAAGAAEVASLQCRLGAVCGCLGDCCRADGDAAGTLERYQESVGLLRAAGDDPEAQQALSVALNKVGELHHLQGDLGAAAQQYQEALQLRRTLLAATQQDWVRQQEQGAGGGEQAGSSAGQAGGEAASGLGAAGPSGRAVAAAEGDQAVFSGVLDLAASCLKLSSARQGLGQAQEAEALLAEAESLLQGAGAGLAGQPELLRRKHASLAQFAGLMRQQEAAA